MEAQLNETNLVIDSIKRLREQDRNALKKFAFGDKVTFWDSDELRVLLKNGKCYLSTEFGEKVLLTGIENVDEKEALVLDCNDIVALQFAPRDQLRAIFVTFAAFKRDGGLGKSEYSCDAVKDIAQYCSRMDDAILAELELLRKQNVRDIFQKMYDYMTGGQDPKGDRLCRRIKFYRDLVENYRVDKNQWKSILVRHRLLKR